MRFHGIDEYLVTTLILFKTLVYFVTRLLSLQLALSLFLDRCLKRMTWIYTYLLSSELPKTCTADRIYTKSKKAIHTRSMFACHSQLFIDQSFYKVYRSLKLVFLIYILLSRVVRNSLILRLTHDEQSKKGVKTRTWAAPKKCFSAQIIRSNLVEFALLQFTPGHRDPRLCIQASVDGLERPTAQLLIELQESAI